MEAAKILELERQLLPEGCHFADDAKDVINCWESTNVLACPGSGKTTVLMAKLQHLADMMPFPEGRGICILSHTNVAVNEIKSRLTGDAAAKILNYPNFAGTLQSFVDSFIVFPFWRSRVRSPIRLVTREEFAKAVWNQIATNKAYLKLRGFISRIYRSSGSWCESEVELIEGWHLDGQNNLCSGNGVLAAANTSTAKTFASLITNLLIYDGLMSYDLSYYYANTILSKNGDLMRPVLSCRFQFVFIDEYQDCSDAQRRFLTQLFDGTDTVVQRIGDRDQAIYNSVYTSLGSEWDTSDCSLEIAETNRYGEEIAHVVSKLRTGGKTIVSQRGALNIRPVLLVYHEGSEKRVVNAFVKEIRSQNLSPRGVFKAVGMVAKGKGTTIVDYWDSFADDGAPIAKDGWEYYRKEVVRQFSSGRLYKVVQIIEELLVLISRCRNMRTEKNGFYTKTRVRRIVAEKIDEGFRDGILQLVAECASDPNKAERCVLVFLCVLCREIFGGDWTEDELSRELSAFSGSETRRRPIPCTYDDGITVSLSTIHAVKGETHDATLYLETDHIRNSDLKRIMPLFVGKPLPNKEVFERSRRCAYVGMSRPRHLLCVAMKAKTYEGHEDIFEHDWNIVKV